MLDDRRLRMYQNPPPGVGCLRVVLCYGLPHLAPGGGEVVAGSEATAASEPEVIKEKKEEPKEKAAEGEKPKAEAKEAKKE